MNKKLMYSALAVMLAAIPLSATAGMGAEENINIYAWQDWSLEFVDTDKDDREYDRVTNNAANIGFMAHLDTGVDGLQIGFRCEQYTYFRQRGANSGSDWCQRNSKISLRHETLGEIMYAHWLLPYNEIVAQWIDPYYDADVTSHSNLMGNLGETAASAGDSSGYYVGGFGEYGQLSFNRRQDGVIQYVWPNTAAMASQSRDGFQFRFALTEGNDTDTDVTVGEDTANEANFNHDPRIYSTGVAYQHNLANGGQIWLAAAYELHDDWSADLLQAEAVCSDSEDEGYRLAGRYTHNWGNGQSTWIAGMYEELDYEADDCRTPDTAAKLNADGSTTAAAPGGRASAPVWSDVERDAWMISGKHNFGNGFDFRFLYADADEWECGANCPDNGNNTDAEAFSFGVSYTLPAGTEFRLTYSEIDNNENSAHDFGIGAVGLTQDTGGADTEVIGLGIVHWFD